MLSVGFSLPAMAASLINYPIDSPVSGGDVEDRPMLAWIFASEEYTELYHEYFSEFIEEYFDSGYFEEMINSTTELISPYVEKDPTKFCTYKEFETGVSTLKEFCLLRAESITRQLQGTIGSTSETQDSETLIGAGDLQISDMGTMNASMAGGGNDSGVDKGAAADSDSMPQKPQDDSNNQHDFAQREDPPPGAREILNQKLSAWRQVKRRQGDPWIPSRRSPEMRRRIFRRIPQKTTRRISETGGQWQMEIPLT